MNIAIKLMIVIIQIILLGIQIKSRNPLMVLPISTLTLLIVNL